MPLPPIIISDKRVGPWDIHAVTFEAEDRSLAVPIHGIIGNSITASDRGKNIVRQWKLNIVTETKKARGQALWNPGWLYSISIGFSFHSRSHYNHDLDVENFLKPALDALAAGLFCSPEQIPAAIPRYNYDDSNFRYLFPYKLEAARSAEDEGAAFYVSVCHA